MGKTRICRAATLTLALLFLLCICPLATVSATGIEIPPMQVSFGNLVQGRQPAAQQVTLQNLSGSPVPVSVSLSGPQRGSFSSDVTGSTTVPVEGLTINVSFTGYHSIGSYTATLVVDDGTDYRIALSATVAAPTPASLSVSVSGLDALQVGRPVVNAAVSYTLAPGDDDIAFGAINPGDFAVGGLPAGLSASAAQKVSSTLVAVPITGTPTETGAAATLTYSTSLPPANFIGADAAPLSPSGGAPVTGPVSAQSPGAAIATAPALSARSSTTVTLSAATLSGPSGQGIEYACSTQNTPPTLGWQDSLTFTSLTADTNYYFFARSKQFENYATGAPGAGVLIRTEAAASPNPGPPANNGNPQTPDPPGDANTPPHAPGTDEAKTPQELPADTVIEEPAEAASNTGPFHENAEETVPVATSSPAHTPMSGPAVPTPIAASPASTGTMAPQASPQTGDLTTAAPQFFLAATSLVLLALGHRVRKKACKNKHR